MRETRSRTGKLPPPKPPAEEFRTPSPEPEPMPADVAKPPTPSSKRVRAGKFLSAKSKSKSKSKKVVEEEELVEVIEEAPRPVFETFETDVTLQDGLSIVRSLGGGKYEIINLKHVDPEAITSAETGAVIKADKKLLKAMEIDDLEWQVAKFKVNQAVGSASKCVPFIFDLCGLVARLYTVHPYAQVWMLYIDLRSLMSNVLWMFMTLD
jgi:hypothetical protein